MKRRDFLRMIAGVPLAVIAAGEALMPKERWVELHYWVPEINATVVVSHRAFSRLEIERLYAAGPPRPQKFVRKWIISEHKKRTAP